MGRMCICIGMGRVGRTFFGSGFGIAMHGVALDCVAYEWFVDYDRQPRAVDYYSWLKAALGTILMVCLCFFGS